MNMRFRFSIILALALSWTVAVHQAKAQAQPLGCCVNPAGFCLGDFTQGQCDQAYASQSSGLNWHPNSGGQPSCAQVTNCAITGKCTKSDGTDCSDGQKWQCDAKTGYNFSQGQLCGDAAVSGTCCKENPSAGQTTNFCEGNIDKNTCQGQRLGQWFAIGCASVPNCPQATGAQVLPPQGLKIPVPNTNIVFNPEIPLPNFVGGPITANSAALYIKAVFIYFIWIVGVLGVVMVTYGGVRWVAAAGNPSRINEARSVINNALIGIVIALTSVVLLNTINPNLTNLNGLNPPNVNSLFLQEAEARPEKTGTRVSTADFPTIAARVQKHPEWIAAVKANASSQIPAARILALLFIESSGNETARSSAGALGLMQVLPSTGADFGFSANDLLVGVRNIKAGAKYLQSLAARTCPADTVACQYGQACKNGDFDYINAAYNGGVTANTCSITCKGQTYSQCVKNDGYAETRNYIQKAESTYQWIISNNFLGS